MKKFLLASAFILAAGPALAAVSVICTGASVSKSTGVSSETMQVTCPKGDNIFFLRGELLQLKGGKVGEALGTQNRSQCTGSAQTFTVTNNNFIDFPIGPGQASCLGFFCEGPSNQNNCISIPPQKVNVQPIP